MSILQFLLLKIIILSLLPRNINRAYNLATCLQCARDLNFNISMQDCSQQNLVALFNALTLSDSEGLKKAEQELNALEQHQEFLEILVSILPMNLQHYAKKAAVVCMQRYVNRIKQNATDHQRRRYVQLLTTVFTKNEVDFKLKLLVVEAGSNLLQKDKHQNLFKQGYKSMELVLQNIGSVDLRIINIDFAVLSGTMLLSCAKKENSQELLSLAQNFMELSIRLLEFIGNNLGICSNQQIENILVRVQQLFVMINFAICFIKDRFVQCKTESARAQIRINLLHQLFQKGYYLWQGKKHKNINSYFWFNSENESLAQVSKSFKIQYLTFFTSFAKHHSLDISQKTYNLIRLIKKIAKDMILEFQQIFLSQKRYFCVGLDILIEQELKLLIALALKDEYKSVIHEQHVHLMRTISRIFYFSHEELKTFYKAPIQFVNSVFSIIDVEQTQELSIQHTSMINMERGAVIQLQNVKILAAKLFKILINIHQSIIIGVSAQIFNTIYHKMLLRQPNTTELLLILCLTKDCKFKGEDIVDNICGIALQIAGVNPLLLDNQKYDQPIEYALALILISIYLDTIAQRSHGTLEKILELSVELISGKVFYEAYRIIGEEIIQGMYKLHSDNVMLIGKMLKELNRRIIILTNNNSLTYNILDSLFFSVDQLVKRQKLLKAFISPCNLKLVEELLYSLGHCVEFELKRPFCDKLVVNKCWNIIRMVGQNRSFVMALMKTLQNIINHLVDYLSIFKKIDFEQDCFLLMASFINHSKKISNFVIALFQLIPSHYYGQYAGKFGHSFQALQMFIYYGKTVLIQPKKQLLTTILEMSLQSLLSSEPDCYQGLLLLQSVLLSVQQHIGVGIWKILVEKVKKKMQNKMASSFLQYNLLGLLGICYKIAKNQWIQCSDINQYLRYCSDVTNRFHDEYCFKVIGYSFCELLLKGQKKYFTVVAAEIKFMFEKMLCFKNKIRQNNLQNLQEFQVLKYNTINKITKLDFENYLVDFRKKFESKFNYSEQPFFNLLQTKNQEDKGTMRDESIELFWQEKHSNRQN